MSTAVLEHPSKQFILSSRGAGTVKRDHAGWTRIIDEKLLDWGRHPEQFEDEILAPTIDAISAAAKTVIDLFRDNAGVPDWVVPTGDGGIAFRWGEAGKLLISLEFDAKGTSRLIVSLDGMIVRELVG